VFNQNGYKFSIQDENNAGVELTLIKNVGNITLVSEVLKVNDGHSFNVNLTATSSGSGSDGWSSIYSRIDAYYNIIIE
jgi:hypothetical protein